MKRTRHYLGRTSTSDRSWLAIIVQGLFEGLVDALFSGGAQVKGQHCSAEAPCLLWRIGEWAADLGITGLLWLGFSPLAALVFFVVKRLMSVRRPHFVDVGRFTAGVFFVSRRNFPPSFAVGFTRYGPDADAPRSGLQLTVGRRSLMVCALLPRDEWADYQRRTAARAVQRKDGTR